MHKQTYRHEEIQYPSNEDAFFNVLWHNRDYTAPHWHNGLEILYLLEGSEDCYLGEDDGIRMKKGDFLVINSRWYTVSSVRGSVRRCCYRSLTR